MTTYLDVFGGEIATIQHMLESLPFDRTEGHSQTKSPYFLDVYRVHRPEMQLLNEDNGKFPLDASKLLKLGISLGNLLKSLQQDEEVYLEQEKKKQQFNKSLGGPLQGGPPSSAAPAVPLGSGAQISLPKPQLQQHFDPVNPFLTDRKTINQLQQQSLPSYQTRFVQNLLKILKNYDIGTPVTMSSYSNNGSSLANFGQDTPGRHLSTTSSSSTLSQQVQSSPIKLSSKQLLIEKLEINIELDNLFTYKIVLKLVKTIYEIVDSQLNSSGSGAEVMYIHSRNSIGNSLSAKDMSSSSSIFSTASYSSTDSSMSLDEYLQHLKQIVHRISVGIIEPFVLLIVTNVAEKGIIDRFGELLKSLD